MRIAVLSDVHGNLTALEAVIADLEHVSPDLIVQGGDLPAGGYRPAEVVDRIRELGWPGVVGNTDEMLWDASGLRALMSRVPALRSLLAIISEDARVTIEKLGPERLSWLQTLPRTSRHGDLVVVHATANDVWTAPRADADDEALRQAYAPLGARRIAYGHLHTPFVRTVGDLTICNSGSVGLPYDGDPRASYALIDNGVCTIRRVSYDVDKEVRGLLNSGSPFADWHATMLQAGRYVPPPVNPTKSL